MQEDIDWGPYRRRLLAIAEALSLQSQVKASELVRKTVAAATTWESLPRLLQTIAHLEVADGVQLICAIEELVRGGFTSGVRFPESTMLGNLFEVSIKWRIKRAGAPSYRFDSPLPNGRNVDVRVITDGLPLNIECTINDMSDDDKDFWDKLIAKTEAAHAETISSGKDFEPVVEVGSRNIYGDARRIFLKVFDKLTDKGNPEKCQLSLTEPNLLCIGFPSTVSQSAMSITVDWALDELFRQRLDDEQQETKTFGKSDVSLVGFLAHGLSTLHEKGRLREAPTSLLVQQLLRQTRLIGAIAFFNGLTLIRLVHNQQAFPVNAITAEHELFFKEAMRRPPNWCPSGPLFE